MGTLSETTAAADSIRDDGSEGKVEKERSWEQQGRDEEDSGPAAAAGSVQLQGKSAYHDRT